MEQVQVHHAWSVTTTLAWPGRLTRGRVRLRNVLFMDKPNDLVLPEEEYSVSLKMLASGCGWPGCLPSSAMAKPSKWCSRSTTSRNHAHHESLLPRTLEAHRVKVPLHSWLCGRKECRTRVRAHRTHQLVDMMTKPLGRVQREKLRSSIGMMKVSL